jgi:hypothetical protein
MMNRSRALSAVLLVGYCGVSAGCDSTEPVPTPQPIVSDPCRAACSGFELAGHAFVALLNAKRYRPAIDVDAMLRRLHSELCAGRPDYFPQTGDSEWLQESYPLAALPLARSAQCGEFILKPGALPGPRGAHELARHQATIAPDLLSKWSNEYIGSAILYLLRFDARRYASEIETLFDLMCGSEASSAHLYDATAFDFVRLREYEFATCDGFSYGGRTRN